MKQKASIIVLNYNGIDLLKKCFGSIVKAGEGHEVILLDNNSADSSVSYIAAQYPQVKIIVAKENRYMFSYNEYVKCAENNIIVLLNNDVVVKEDFLEPLLPYFARQDVFAVTPKIISAEDNSLLQGRRSFGIKGGFLHPSNPGEPNESGFTLFASGGAAAFCKKKFIELEGFDELYWPFYREDIDLSYRAWLKGYKVIYEPRSKVFHYQSSSIKKVADPNSRRLRDKINYLFVWKNVVDIKWLVSHFAWIFLRLLKALFLFDFQRLLGFLDAFKRIRLVIRAGRKSRKIRRKSDKSIKHILDKNPFQFKLKNKNILIFGYSKWGVWRADHEFASELKKHNNVVFVENQTKNLLQAVLGLFFKSTGFVNKDSIKVFSSPASFPVLGFVWPKILRRFFWNLFVNVSKSSLKRTLKKAFKKTSFKPDLVFVFNPYDLYFAKEFNENITCYRVYDEVAAFPSQSKIRSFVSDFEKKHIRRVDYIFASSKKQAENRKTFSENVHLLRNGYNNPLDKNMPVPEDLKRIKSPRIGFIGGIDHRLDFKLLDFIANKLNNMSFVFIGPVLLSAKSETEKLSKKENFHFLGIKDPKELRGYLNGLDASIIPYYTGTDQLKATFPWKVFEHLAAGVPIVSTNLDELEDFKDYLNVAGSCEEFVELVKGSINNRESKKVKDGIRLAENNTWNHRIEFIENLLLWNINNG